MRASHLLAAENKDKHYAFTRSIEERKIANAETGPLGSVHCRVPINIPQLQKELTEPNSSVLRSWKRDDLKEWAKNISSSRRPFKMSVRCDQMRPSVILTHYAIIHYLGIRYELYIETRLKNRTFDILNTTDISTSLTYSISNLVYLLSAIFY